MPIWGLIIFFYLSVMNITMYVMMWSDKRKAEQEKWRIKERTLWTVAFLGGAIGGWLAMRLFRHKTKRTAFAIGLPGLSLVYLTVLLFLERLF
ncbi:DUF1294 domain-containing protein [Halobacillus litoralis]|uniref:DUF1294 domain-containing protein n=1 Tax=Halobacillus litoralis TaxID=45668 RepID=UPI001CD55E50|nr:DUF1294 domain-containing protein [Halobacillus litoralis]MCA0969859.1 DUF1294 domain-containing protein [Halobacillus litoralis]